MPKSKENQLGILKFYAFSRKTQRGPQVQERALLEFCIYDNTPEKFTYLPLKVTATLFSG